MGAVLLGNEAVARGIVESGCQIATGYPGTPSSEILPAVENFNRQEGTNLVVRWSVNEKVAFEVAVSAAYTGKRATVVMKQVGLNVAADPFMSSAFTSIEGGFLIVVADDPGLYSSQTKQDTRFFGMFGRVPVLDPMDIPEAKKMVVDGFAISEKFHIPVILRLSLRISHGRQEVEFNEVIRNERKANFVKNPPRWVCVPKFRRAHEVEVAQKIRDVETYFEQSEYNFVLKGSGRLGIIAGGLSYAVLKDVLNHYGINDLPVLKISTPYPLPVGKVMEFIEGLDRVLVLEETYPTIEIQIPDRRKIEGRLNGFVSTTEELGISAVEDVLSRFLGRQLKRGKISISSVAKDVGVEPRPPVMCPGCPHRASFWNIRKAFPKGIYPSDIGCYGLGLNQKAVDCVVCMGGGVTQAEGISLAYEHDGEDVPVIGTMGDSTFFHMGVPGLIDAVANNGKFILVILDNSTTAMTGQQPTPATGYNIQGKAGQVDIATVVRGCGVDYVKEIDPYDVKGMVSLLKDAWEYVKREGKVAVVIAKHSCILLGEEQECVPVMVNEEKCIGCRICIDYFYCPGLVFDTSTGKAKIDPYNCIECGVCRNVCPVGAIVGNPEEVKQ